MAIFLKSKSYPLKVWRMYILLRLFVGCFYPFQNTPRTDVTCCTNLHPITSIRGVFLEWKQDVILNETTRQRQNHHYLWTILKKCGMDPVPSLAPFNMLLGILGVYFRVYFRIMDRMDVWMAAGWLVYTLYIYIIKIIYIILYIYILCIYIFI